MSSKRETICDRIVSLFTSIAGGTTWYTTVQTVGTEIPEDIMDYPPGKCPAVFVIDTDATETPNAVGSDDEDMQAEMMILAACVVYNRTSTKTARNEMVREMKKAVLTDTVLSSLLYSIERISVVTDKGMSGWYSHFDVTLTVRYGYDHTVGG